MFSARIMTVFSVVIILSVAATVSLEVQSICQNSISCPCGSTGKNVTVCIERNTNDSEICKKWSNCKICEDGSNECLQCEDEFEDPLCSVRKGWILKSRQKRSGQPLSYHPARSKRSRSSRQASRYCSKPYNEKLGSLRCVTSNNNQKKTCVGKCSPGYSFENFESAEEITLTCEKSVWSPLNGFPPCKSVPDKATCPDPGFIANGFRRRTDGSDSNSRRSVQEGDSVVYVCQSDQFALQGSALLTCKSDGTWSNPLPKCISPTALTEILCQDPGHVANAERLNSDGTLSMGVQQYRVGQSVVYTCDPGYVLQSRSRITCLASGRWSSSAPLCDRVTEPDRRPNTMFCDNPGKILNGRFEVYPPVGMPKRGPSVPKPDDVDFPEGTQLEYSCNAGYVLNAGGSLVQGPYFLTCQSSSYWNPPKPPRCDLECGISFASTTRKIHNGNKTLPGEWPWVVAITVQENNRSSRLICGGVLLNSDTMMTAAHCLTDSDRFVLYFGKLHRNNKDDDEGVVVGYSTRIIINPAFSNDSFDSDIGLVKFEPPVQFSTRIQPVCLPSSLTTYRNSRIGRKGYVTGWGMTERRLPANEMLVVEIPVLSNEACMASYRNHNLKLPLTQNMFCAGFPNGQRTACEGDSGSPLVFYDSIERRYTVEGIVSFGVQGQCGLPGRYTVFTKVFHFVPWILEYL